MKKLGLMIAAAGAAFAVPAGAQNLVTNGGFEDGNTGFDSQYSYVGTTGGTALYGEGTYTVGQNADQYHNLWADVPAYAGSYYLIANGAENNTLNVWSQTLTGLTVGKLYDFSAYVTNVCCNANFTGVNNPPVVLASDGGLLNTTATATSTGNWVHLSGFFTPLATSSTISIRALGGQGSGNDLGLDAISVAAVPEPATWGMMILGLGMIGYAMRRRRATVAAAIA